MEEKVLGRPTIYTEALATKICDRIASGESVRTICKDDDMPNSSTVHDWVKTNHSFSKQYDEARQKQAANLFDEILEIADDGTNDYVEKEIEKGKVIVVADGEHISRSRLRVDTRKWYMSKVLPKIYGDKSEVDITTNGESMNSISTLSPEAQEAIRKIYEEETKKKILNP